MTQVTIDEETVKAVVHSAILKALGTDKEKIITEIIDTVLKHNPKDRFGREEGESYLQQMVRQKLSFLVNQVVQEIFEELKPDLKAELKKKMLEGNIIDQFIKAAMGIPSFRVEFYPDD